jgi:hypothetical protein
MANIQQDFSQLYKANILTPEQEIRANLLSPETIARFENEIARLTDQLATTRFTLGDQNELFRQLSGFVFMQSQRETLISLLSECSNAYSQLASGDQ